MNKETWSGALASFRSIRPWQIILLIVVLLGAGIGTFAVYSYLTGSESTELEEDQQLIPVQRGDLVKEVSISGSVSFPNRETLTFGSAGIVDELLVEEGERVDKGQTLATLDAETIAGLEEAAAKARVDLRDAEEALADYLEPPSALVISEAKHKVAEAELSLQTATEALEETLEPTPPVEVADAEAKIASLRLDLQNAEDKLAELLDPISALDVEKAQADVESARLAVGDAEEASRHCWSLRPSRTSPGRNQGSRPRGLPWRRLRMNSPASWSLHPIRTSRRLSRGLRPHGFL